MKPNIRQNFKAGNRISSMLDQIANNIILFDDIENNFRMPNNNCITSVCSNITGVFDCQFDNIGEVKKQPHNTFLVKMSGDSMQKAGINDGDILLVDNSTQAVNNSIIVAEINDCICIRRIKYLNNHFTLFSDSDKYPPIIINNTDNFLIWGVVRTTLEIM